MKRQNWIEGLKLSMADYLSRLACALRGKKWYQAETWAACHGNRAAELKQRIWESCVIRHMIPSNEDPEFLKLVESDLNELGQMAGENWGHVK